MLTYSSNLATALAAATTKAAWFSAFTSALGPTPRVICSHSGVAFRNCALTGGFTIANQKIAHLGYTSDTQVYTAANLSSTPGVLRIEGNGYWLEGSLGLLGSGNDFEFSSNPTTSNGLALSSLNIAPPAELPDDIVSGHLVPVDGVLTTVTFENLSASASGVQPVTFGQTFIEGAFPATSALVELKDTSNNIVAAQIDVKATHGDGSIRHAIISASVPSLSGSESKVYSIIRKTALAVAPLTPPAFVSAGLEASVTIVDAADSVTYTANLAAHLTANNYTNWLSGPEVSEWIVVAPLKTAGNVEHPHLHVRFNVRGYKGSAQARVDVTVENTWLVPATGSTTDAWEMGRSDTDVTYSVDIVVGGSTIYSNAALVHYYHTRFRKIAWWGTTPVTHIRHNKAYLIASKAVPNYDQSIVPSATKIASNKSTLATRNAPMQSGLLYPSQGTTGGRPDIALLPGWVTLYLLDMGVDSKEATLTTADLFGSWSAHYRNKATDHPVSIVDYPWFLCDLTVSLNDTKNTNTNKQERAPVNTGGLTNPNSIRPDHLPEASFVPYLVTGDLYHLEEQLFWIGLSLGRALPAYRGFAAGYIYRRDPRESAWVLRTIAHGAYMTPDNHPQKGQLATFVENNLSWYTANVVNGSGINELGYLQHPYTGSIIYAGTISGVAKVGIANWQDDYFTQTIGRVKEVGFASAEPLLVWKTKYLANRLLNPQMPWIFGALYNYDVRASEAGALFTTMTQVYEATVPADIRAAIATYGMLSPEAVALIDARYTGTTIEAGEMPWYSDSAEVGFANIMQAAVSYGATSSHAQAGSLWAVIDGRAGKPDFTQTPQWAIVPRS